MVTVSSSSSLVLELGEENFTAGNPGSPLGEEEVAGLRGNLGLDRPAIVQYGTWLGRFVRGDWGSRSARVCPSGRWFWSGSATR